MSDSNAPHMLNRDFVPLDVECPKCAGKGEIGNARSPEAPRECAHCEGYGFITKAQSVRDEVVAAVLAEVAKGKHEPPPIAQTYQSWILSAAYCVREAMRLNPGGVT